jgi:hypothetical protein
MSKNIKNFLSFTDKNINNFKWKYLSPRNKSLDKFSLHFLMVKEPKYAGVLKTCIDSFLYWHPESEVTIHLDSITRDRVLKEIVNRRNHTKIKVIIDMDYDSKSWQELKLKLISSLNGTNEIYLDADMRWNGCLQKTNSITFLTTEIKLKNTTSFLFLLKNLRDGKFMESFMRNTSFFTFAGIYLPKALIDDLVDLHKEIISLIGSEMIGVDDRSNLIRIAEQLTLSLASQNWNSEILSLKEMDKYKDGAFLESSYFGSTGTRF